MIVFFARVKWFSKSNYLIVAEGKARKQGSYYRYEYTLNDHLGNSRVMFYQHPSSGLIDVLQSNDYYPFGKAVGGTIINQYPYNSKELQEELGQLDYGARFYDPVIGRWNVVDKKSELYFSHSPFTYALNTPTNAIDPDGNLVIFINGNHFGDGATGYEKWREIRNNNYNFQGSNAYWNIGGISFDRAVMKQLHDNNSMYRDGAIGGYFGFNSHGLVATNMASYRQGVGKKQGMSDAATIVANLARDKQGNIIESIKVITHSMGGAYGKGYVEALKKYISSLPKELQAQIKITLVADFDPFQAGSLEADPNIFTQQISHIGKKGRNSSDRMG